MSERVHLFRPRSVDPHAAGPVLPEAGASNAQLVGIVPGEVSLADTVLDLDVETNVVNHDGSFLGVGQLVAALPHAGQSKTICSSPSPGR